MKKKKKIILAITLSAVIAIGGILTFIFAIPIGLKGGTETAKILLARERLDETHFTQKLNFYDQNIGVIQSLTEANADNGREVTLNVSDTDAPVMFNKSKGTATDKGDHVEWTDFPAISSTMIALSNSLESIEMEALDVAEFIGKIKKNVGITDKWINFIGEYEYMLTVQGNAEVLLRRTKDGSGDYKVAKRFTRADAKNVYEMFSYYNYEDGTTGEIRMMYIPGERYEYMYDNSNGFNDYFIADNSRGYWTVMRMNTNGSDFSCDTTILKDGLGYNAFIQLSDEKEAEAAWYEIFDVKNSTDIMRYSQYWKSASIEMHFGAMNGVKSVKTNPEQKGHIYTERGGLEFHALEPLTVTGEKGEIPNTAQNGVTHESTYVRYDPEDEYYVGQMRMNVEGEEYYTPSDYLEKLINFYDGYGITLTCDKQLLEEGINFASMLEAEFGRIYEWNGNKLYSINSAFRAREVLKGFYYSSSQIYSSFKDAETITPVRRSKPAVDFAPITTVGQSQVALTEGKITVDGVTAKMTDTKMLEANGTYVLQVALAKREGNGYSSTEEVPLSGGTANAITYSGGEITLTAGGEYTLPLNLSEGEYGLVVYIATAKDGIRVSEMTAIASSSSDSEGEEVPSEAMQVVVNQKGGELTVNYTVKLLKQVEITEAKESYTYDEIERLLLTYVLSYGYPKEGETIQTFDGAPLVGDEVLTEGSYKIKCYLATKDGLSEAFVYCSIG